MLAIDPTQIQFNWPNARACAEACALAYAAETAALPSDTTVVYDRLTEACAIIQIRRGELGIPDCILVAFRGSQDAKDYIQDGKFALTELIYTDGDLPAEVHEGFLQDFDSIDVDLVHAVNNAIQSTGAEALPVIVTGHSLGGALAILCALEFVRQKFYVAGVYTFGQPRVGNQGFVDIYDGTILSPALSRDAATLGDITYRVVNENDMVPRVPPWINGYRHGEQNIFLPVSGGWELNPSLWRIGWSNCLGFFNALRGLDDVLVADHHIGAYQDRIKNLT